MKRLFIILTIALLLFNCTSQQQKKAEKQENISEVYDYDLARYFHSHTEGEIKPDDPLIIRFSENLVPKDRIEKTAENVRIQIEPEISGKAIWQSKNVIRFEPDNKWKGGQSYQITIDINEMISEDLHIKPLKFKITGMQQNILMYEAEFSDINETGNKTAYTGSLKFLLSSTLDKLRKATRLKLKGKEIDLTWEGSHTHFTFRSEAFNRPQQKTGIEFVIDKKIMEMEDDFIRKSSFFSLHAMEVILVKRNHDQQNPGIEVQFSNLIDEEQMITGYFDIEPDMDFNLKKLGKKVLINGDFEFGKRYVVTIKKGIKNQKGIILDRDHSEAVLFNDENPQIIFVHAGSYLPSGNRKKIQFRSINIKKVNLTIKHVFENNLNYFLQNYDLKSPKSGSSRYSNVNRVGEVVYDKNLQLGEVRNSWLLNEIDLAELIPQGEKGLYQIELSFTQEDIYYRGLKGGRNDYYTNPLSRGYYYRNGKVTKPIILSDIGLTYKQGSEKSIVFATDLMNAEPISGCYIYLKSYQNQILTSTKTNSDGRAEFVTTKKEPFFVEAEYNGQRTVLRQKEMRWNTSTFDVKGVQYSNDGIRAYTYTERGVYRPGDKINLSMIFRNREGTLPEDHPVKVQLHNPNRQLIESKVLKNGKDGFYNYALSTGSSDPTGNWKVTIKVGSSTFYHKLKIETVVAERLNIEIIPGQDKVEFGTDKIGLDLQAKYLFGAPAANLNCVLDAEIYKNLSLFDIPRFRNFNFDNPSIDYKMIEEKIAEAALDAKGNLSIDWKLPDLSNAPTALVAKIIANVSEKGGRASKEKLFLPIDPFPAYVGLHSSQQRWKKLGKSNKFQAILLAPDGSPRVGEKLKVRIYYNHHYWWWDYSRNKSHFKNDEETEFLNEFDLTSAAQPVEFEFTPPQYGKYLLEVTHDTGDEKGHSSAQFFWASSWGNPNEGMQDAGIITINSDKTRYIPGDKAKISFDSPPNSMTLVSLEKGDQIITEYWQKTKEGRETIEIDITKDMVPNIYCSISIIQPHDQTDNDRPIRMYGIIPLHVFDSTTRQKLKLTAPESIKPNSTFKCKLQTEDSRQTQFTIAVVDEGLLSLTDFTSPDAWQKFYQKQLLGVKTYDTYGYVIGINRGDIYKTFSVGGGISFEKERKKRLSPEQTKRFKPVCLFQGPLWTNKTGAAEVEFSMPEYLGAVRVMVVSANGERYGNAQKTIEVKEDIVLLPTLPRMLAPGDRFKIPVEVFSTKDNVGKVEISISSEGPVNLTSSKQHTLNFKETSSKSVAFDAKVPMQVGVAKIIISASFGDGKVQSTTDIAIRPLSPLISKRETKTCKKDQTIEFQVPDDGIAGTNEALLSISRLPRADISKHIKWLIRYPYGCVEQVTSSVFPQLYLQEFIRSEEYDISLITNNINKGVVRLKKYQLADGSFSYWPGRPWHNKRGTSYAGHFLLAAQESGYYVQQEMIDNWINYQSNRARRYKFHKMDYKGLREQIYRLFLLAKAGKPQIGALNYMRENHLNFLNDTERWLLAAAYHMAGIENIAEQIAMTSGIVVKDYLEMSHSFGSQIRDKAMILDAMIILDEKEKALDLYLKLSDLMSQKKWYSTQTTGYTLMALGRYIQKYHGKTEEPIKGFIVEANGKQEKVLSNEINTNYNVKASFGNRIRFTSQSDIEDLFVTLNWSGIPIKSQEQNRSDGLKLRNKWVYKNNQVVDLQNIKQGDVFSQEIYITNTSDLDLKNVAVTQILPSGWEIVNERLEDDSSQQYSHSKNKTINRRSVNRVDYEDIRDDRKMWFFDLKRNAKIALNMKLRAVTIGEFYMPATYSEVMYDNRFQGVISGKDVKVKPR